MTGRKTKKGESSYLVEATERHELFFPGKKSEVYEEKFRRYYKTGKAAVSQAESLLKFKGASSVKVTNMLTGRSKKLRLGPTEYPIDPVVLLGAGK